MPLQMAATGDLNCIKGVEKVEGKRYYVSKKGVKSILQALLLFENKIQLRIPFGYLSPIIPNSALSKMSFQSTRSLVWNKNDVGACSMFYPRRRVHAVINK
jgi:hypothetical protein